MKDAKSLDEHEALGGVAPKVKSVKKDSKEVKLPRGLSKGKFKTYDMLELKVPKEAYPQSGKHHGGEHGYTVTAPNSSTLSVNSSAKQLNSIPAVSSPASHHRDSASCSRGDRGLASQQGVFHQTHR